MQTYNHNVTILSCCFFTAFHIQKDSKVLGVVGSNVEEEVKEESAVSQYWTKVKENDGYFFLQNPHSSKFLTADQNDLRVEGNFN